MSHCSVLRHAQQHERPATLIVDAWLATSNDGVVRQETHAGGLFNFANAPMADGGLFIGDYRAIARDSQAFYPFFAMTNASATNKSDIFASAFRSIVAPTTAAVAKAFEARRRPPSFRRQTSSSVCRTGSTGRCNAV